MDITNPFRYLTIQEACEYASVAEDQLRRKVFTTRTSDGKEWVNELNLVEEFNIPRRHK